ncbi:MAG: SCP2 sterol-binding domain-containing protein [bacterium]
MAELIIKEPESMNIMGLILKHLMEQNLKDAGKAEAARKMNCVIAMRGGKMGVTITFRSGTITIERGTPPRANSRINGSLNTFLQVAVSKNYISPLLSGKIRISGNPFPLLKLITFLAA